MTFPERIASYFIIRRENERIFSFCRENRRNRPGFRRFAPCVLRVSPKMDGVFFREGEAPAEPRRDDPATIAAILSPAGADPRNPVEESGPVRSACGSAGASPSHSVLSFKGRVSGQLQTGRRPGRLSPQPNERMSGRWQNRRLGNVANVRKRSRTERSREKRSNMFRSCASARQGFPTPVALEEPGGDRIQSQTGRPTADIRLTLPGIQRACQANHSLP